MIGRARASTRPLLTDEAGLVLPLMAALLLTLMVFAAFAVDLGAVWAERRTDQSGADASVMAGAVEIIVDTPTEAGVVDEVRDYVERNVGLVATSPDWLTCVDVDRPISYIPLVDSNGDTMDCISVDNSTRAPALILRTKVPDQDIDTLFAPVIGIDTLTTDAQAEAEIKVGIAGEGGIIPFALPQDYSSEECLGTPPDGQIPADSLCEGPQQGNFGTIISPNFGAGPPHDTFLSCPPPNDLDRIPHQVAIGLDHLIGISPTPLVPPGGKPATGADDCPQVIVPPPYVLNTDTGNPFSGGGAGAWPPVPVSPNVAVAVGMVGNGPFGTAGELGRLRQLGGLNTGGSPDQRKLQTTDPTDVVMDNVGLWEYLDSSSKGLCHPTKFDPPKTGTELTTQMQQCLSSPDPIADLPQFVPALFASPRFALVPLLNFKHCSNGADPLCVNGTSWVHVTGFRAVYLQSTWYKCGGPNFCVWESADGKFLQAFNPGEGTVDSCEGIPDDMGTTGSCTGIPASNKVKLEGVSAFVLEWNYLPSGADPTGTGSPFFAEMFR